MKYISLIFLVTSSLNFCHSQVSKEVKNLSEKLDTVFYAESSHVGVAGMPSKIFTYFRTIDAIATNDELFHFAKHGSNSLRLYSSESLVNRKDIKKIISLYKLYLIHSIEIPYQSGCLIDNLSITKVIRNRLNSIEHVLKNDERKRIKNRQVELRSKLKNHELCNKELELYKYSLKVLKKQELFLNKLYNWTKNDLEEVIRILNLLDKQFKENGYIDLD